MGNHNSTLTFAFDETLTDHTDVIPGWRLPSFVKTSQTSILPILKEVEENIENNPAWPFLSSETNYEKAEEEYNKSPVELYVATAFGDEIPKMRDDLIDRKHHGENFILRHWHAWTHLSNWKVDPNSENKEEADPAHYDEKTKQSVPTSLTGLG